MKQHEAVIQAMDESGGYATLGKLYHTVLKLPGCNWGTKTPFASIRRIVQTNPAFFRIRPGLWGLAAHRARVLQTLAIPEGDPPSLAEEFNHTYYQGLIAEIGNLEGYDTAVPPQDKNRLFLQNKLSEVATLHEAYCFTYDHLVRRARTVDVAWYNDRKLPGAFFEVEHSTNIQNSLLKFLEFQDFRIAFYIVGDAARRGEFDDKLAHPAFRPMRDEVRFMDYQSVSDLHSKIAAASAAQQVLGPRAARGRLGGHTIV